MSSPSNSEYQTLLTKSTSGTYFQKIIWLGMAVCSLLISGVLIGFAPLKKAFLEEQPDQFTSFYLDLVFFIALSIMTIITYPVGLFLDRYGSKKLILFGGGCQILGFGVLSVVASPPHWSPTAVILMLLVGFILNGLANPMIFTALVPVSRFFPPGWDKLIISFLTGIWDLSTIFGWFIHFLSPGDRQSPVNVPIFVSLAAIGLVYLLIWLLTWIFFPGKTKFRKSLYQLEVDHPGTTQPVYREWLMILGLSLVAISCVLHTNFYLTNVLEILTDFHNLTDDQLENCLISFSLIFPLVGFVAALITGLFLARLSRLIVLILIWLNFILFSVLSIIPLPIFLIHVEFVSYIFYRMTIYSLLNIIIVLDSNPQKIGRNFGIIYGLAGLFNFLAIPLTELAKVIGFQVIMISLAVLSFICLTSLVGLEVHWDRVKHRNS